MTATMNGRARKSLAEQIEKLDSMLDGLSENLNEAIAGAVKEAVRAVLLEVLTNPVLCANLQTALSVQGVVPQTAPSSVTQIVNCCRDAASQVVAGGRKACQWIGQGMSWLLNKCRQGCQQVGARCVTQYRQVQAVITTTWQTVQVARRLAMPVLTAVLIGLLVAALAYWSGPVIASAASGVGGFVTALSVQAGLWLRRAVLKLAQEG